MRPNIKNGGKTLLLGGIGGLLAAGAKMLIEPSLFKTQQDMVKKCWVAPAGEMVLGAIGGAFDKTAMAGAGMAGAGVAHLVENVNQAIAIKRNTQSQTQGLDAGALVMPQELVAPRNAGALMSGPNLNVGSFYDETGALVFPSRRAA